MKGTTFLLAGFAAALAACDSSTPLQTENHAMHPGSLMLSDLENAQNAPALDALHGLMARYHAINQATAAGYNLLIAPVTAPDGCISDVHAGGMGYHYTRGNNLGDDAATLLDPEFIVYAPKKGEHTDNNGDVARELAAVEYFIPFSPKWPAPSDPTFQRAPSLHDFPTMTDLPDLSFTSTTRFGGWMFHIWLFENNPDGEFANFNVAVPLCQNSAF
jgi:hypothetical protein